MTVLDVISGAGNVIFGAGAALLVGALVAYLKGNHGLAARCMDLYEWLLRPMAVAYLGRAVVNFHEGDPARAGMDVAFALLLAYLDHRSDDGRWKRLRDRLTAKVCEVAGRLVVTPVPAGAR